VRVVGIILWVVSAASLATGIWWLASGEFAGVTLCVNAVTFFFTGLTFRFTADTKRYAHAAKNESIEGRDE